MNTGIIFFTATTFSVSSADLALFDLNFEQFQPIMTMIMDVVVYLRDSPSGERVESGELIECGLNPLDRVKS